MAVKKRRLLIFAAASDPGALFEWFPAWLPDVISVRGAGLEGDLIPDYNPIPSRTRESPMFCTLARDVPCELGNSGQNQMSGCPVATPILAATAALFLQYAACMNEWGFEQWRADALHEKETMENLFQEIGRKVQGRTWFVQPRDLFEGLNEDSRLLPPVLRKVLSQIPERE